MEFVSPNEEDAFNIDLMNKKKTTTPSALKNKKAL